MSDISLTHSYLTHTSSLDHQQLSARLILWKFQAKLQFQTRKWSGSIWSLTFLVCTLLAHKVIMMGYSCIVWQCLVRIEKRSGSAKNFGWKFAWTCPHFPSSIRYCSSSLGPDGSLAAGRLNTDEGFVPRFNFTWWDVRQMRSLTLNTKISCSGTNLPACQLFIFRSKLNTIIQWQI